jgi:hypothetical protein
MNFPYACSRCGCCCLASVCVVGQRVYGLFEKEVRCPGLSFQNGMASCKLVAFNLVPVGDGCCIKARAFKNGVEYDFVALPADTKRQIVGVTLKGGCTK